MSKRGTGGSSHSHLGPARPLRAAPLPLHRELRGPRPWEAAGPGKGRHLAARLPAPGGIAAWDLSSSKSLRRAVGKSFPDNGHQFC